MIPFGFDVIQHEGKKYLQENPEQTKVITDIIKNREDGLSYKKIAKLVNQEYGTKLSHMGVKRVIGRL